MHKITLLTKLVQVTNATVEMADDQVADGQAPDDLTQGVRVCVANLTKVTDELSDAITTDSQITYK